MQVAKLFGAERVIAAGRAGSGIEGARELGADVVVPMHGGREDAAAIAEAASEVDVVLDYLWGAVTQAALPQVSLLQ